MTNYKSIIKIALADDEALLLDLLKEFFEKQSHISVELTALDGEELIEKLNHQKSLPDIILLDLRMKNMDGMETTAVLRQDFPEISIIIMSSYYKKSFTGYMLKSGVNAFIPKGISPERLMEAIHSVYEKGYYFLKDQVDIMRTQISSKAPQPRLSPEELLTQREKEILALICQQYTTQEIAEKLFIAKRTVEGHRNNLLLKTRVKNTAGLVIYAIQKSLVNPDECLI